MKNVVIYVEQLKQFINITYSMALATGKCLRNKAVGAIYVHIITTCLIMVSTSIKSLI